MDGFTRIYLTGEGRLDFGFLMKIACGDLRNTFLAVSWFYDEISTRGTGVTYLRSLSLAQWYPVPSADPKSGCWYLKSVPCLQTRLVKRCRQPARQLTVVF